MKNGVKIVFYFWFPTSFFNVGLRTGEFSLVLDEDRVVVPSSQMQQGKDKGTNMTKMSQISQSGSNQGKVYVHNTSPLKPPQGRGGREDYCAPDSKSMALQPIPHSSLVIPHPSHGEETPPGTPQNTGSVCLQVRSHLWVLVFCGTGRTNTWPCCPAPPLLSSSTCFSSEVQAFWAPILVQPMMHWMQERGWKGGCLSLGTQSPWEVSQCHHQPYQHSWVVTSWMVPLFLPPK